jgi:hypothetical protein
MPANILQAQNLPTGYSAKWDDGRDVNWARRA